MTLLDYIKRGIHDRSRDIIFALMSSNSWSAWRFDRYLARRRFREVFGVYPNLESPTSFSEKVIYKQIYDRRPLLTKAADKLGVRDYVSSIIGEQYLARVYQVAETPEGIDWEVLPPKFVVKANHGSGWNIIVKDKKVFDVAAARSQLKDWLSTNWYFYTREWCYRDIKPQVFVEEFLEGDDGSVPDDWKFFVYSGRAVYVQVDRGRFSNHRHSFYRRDLSQVDVRYLCDNLDRPPAWPENLDKMFEVAEALGRDFDFVRVDLYNVGGRIVFGELTNYPNAGLMPFEPSSVDVEFGSHWHVPARYV